MRLCPQCGAEYDPDQSFCSRDGSALHTVEPTANLLGRVIADRYRVLSQIGEGGMGRVYLAEHVRIGRRNALKVMRSSMLGDAEAVARFAREARNASRIEHPNVAAVYDFGETSDGLTYIAMEYVAGEPLSRLLDRGEQLAPRRIAGIVRQVAAALQAAHELGIVHRDLKPDNVMLAPDRDGSDRVKVVDFGIAKVVDAAEQKVTISGVLVGTPAWMSPEQVACEPLDGRSDQYTLAVMAVKLLTGELPFGGDSTFEVMTSRLAERPRPLRQLRPGLHWPAELQAALDRAMALSPGERFGTVTEFADAFGAALEALVRAPGGDLTMVVGAGAEAAVNGAAALPADGDVRAQRVPATRAARRTGRARRLVGDLALATVVLAGAWVAGSRVRSAPDPAPRRDVVPESVGGAIELGPGAGRRSGANGSRFTKALSARDTAEGGPTAPPRSPATPHDDAAAAARALVTPGIAAGAGGDSLRVRLPVDSAGLVGVRQAADPLPPAPHVDSGTRAPTLPTAAEIATVRQLAASEDDDGALSRAVVLSADLLRRTHARTDSLLLLYYRARALAFLARTDEACRTLGTALRLGNDHGIISTVRATRERLGCE